MLPVILSKFGLKEHQKEPVFPRGIHSGIQAPAPSGGTSQGAAVTSVLGFAFDRETWNTASQAGSFFFVLFFIGHSDVAGF